MRWFQFRIISRSTALLQIVVLASACGGGGSSSDRPAAPVPAPVPVNQLPAASIALSTSDGFAPLTIEFDGTGSSDSDGQISAYSWDFDDGTPTVSGPRVSHQYTDPGGYNVSLTVTDDEGASASILQNIRVRGARLTGTVQILASSAVDSDVNDRLTTPIGNNDPLSAQPLPNPVRLGGFVNLPGSGEATGNFFASGDVSDFFAVSLAGNELILLNIGDASADLDLRLWDTNGKLLDASLDTRTTESLVAPAAGDYFIEVLAATAATNIAGGSNYVLSVGQDLSISSRAPARLSDAFVAGELLLTTRPGSNRKAVHRAYDLAELGRSGRYSRTRLGGRTEERLRQRHGRPAETLTGGRLTPQQWRKYRTLLALKSLPSEPEIQSAELNLLMAPNLEPDDALYPLQWHLREINLPAAWDITTGTSIGLNDIIVAVVDTGILPGHPDLAGQLVPGYDFIADPARARDFDGIDPDPTDQGDFAYGASSSFHGTHVAGTVAAQTDNAGGVAGVAWNARLMPLRALGVDGGTTFDVVQAVRFAAGLSNESGTSPAQRADIINLSLGSPFFSASAQATINEARANGVILIASAGNESSASPSYPAAYDGVVSVSATTIEGGSAPYSNFGSTIDVAAPGGFNGTDFNGDGFGDGVVSTLGDDSNPGELRLGYGGLNGTSMAAPHVAGVAALMKALHPGLTPAEFDAALVAGDLTDDLGTAGYDQTFGHGLINAQKAVLTALALAGGSGADPGPVLASSLSTINFGLFAASQPITLSNLGSGSIQIDQIVSSEPWLTFSPSAVDAAGLGEYELRVERTGLGEGAYNASVRFVPLAPATNPVTVSVTLQVAGANPDADAGLFYVIAVREDGGTEGNAAVVNATNGNYTFALNDLPAGTYRIFAGSDMDDDGFLCDAGEACGAYRTLDALEQIVVDPATAAEVTGLDFVSEFRAVIGVQSAVAGSPGKPTQADFDGIPIRKPIRKGQAPTGSGPGR